MGAKERYEEILQQVEKVVPVGAPVNVYLPGDDVELRVALGITEIPGLWAEGSTRVENGRTVHLTTSSDDRLILEWLEDRVQSWQMHLTVHPLTVDGKKVYDAVRKQGVLADRALQVAQWAERRASVEREIMLGLLRDGTIWHKALKIAEVV